MSSIIERVRRVMPEKRPSFPETRLGGNSVEDVLRRVERRIRVPEDDVIITGKEFEVVSLYNFQQLTQQTLYSQSKDRNIGTFYKLGGSAMESEVFEQKGLMPPSLSRVPFAAVIWAGKYWWTPHRKKQ